MEDSKNPPNAFIHRLEPLLWIHRPSPILVPLIRDRPTKLRATSCGGDRASQAARSGAGRSMNLRGRGGGFTDRGRAEQMEESMQLRLLIRRHANQFQTELFLPRPADDGKVPG